MRVTFYCSTTETLEYLRMVHAILMKNKEVEADCQAYSALKSAVESLTDRLNKVEADWRHKVCR